MNVEANPTGKPIKFDWKKIAVIAVVLAVAGYQWYAQNYPSEQLAVETGQSGTFSDDDYQVKTLPDATANGEVSAKTDTNSKPNFKPLKSKTSEPYLKSAGGKNLKSPAGLIYTSSRSEHRSDHVLRHARDIPDRKGSHGVFNANGDDVFRLVDEAYELVKKKSRQVKTKPAEDGKTEYVIDMKRKIGYKGGRTGKSQNHPPLYKVKLILGDNRVITAYPY